MITLHKLVPPENLTLFERFPALNDIWEVYSLQHEARESFEQYGDEERYPGESTGEIFSISKGEMAIGIIGWFEHRKSSDIVRLRYYGIIPSERGHRYGDEAMRLFLEHLSTAAPKHYVWLAESVSLNRKTAEHVIAHFKKMGFEEFDDPDYGSNAGNRPVKSLRIRIPGR